MGLAPIKGRTVAGSDVGVSFWDTGARWALRARSPFDPGERRTLAGRVKPMSKSCAALTLGSWLISEARPWRRP